MRLKVGVLKPVLTTLWDPEVDVNATLEIFRHSVSLFIAKPERQPYQMYGTPVVKSDVKTAKRAKLQNFKSTHAKILNLFKTRPEIFSSDVANLEEKLDALMEIELGPLPQQVDQSSGAGSKTRARAQSREQGVERQKENVIAIAVNAADPIANASVLRTKELRR